jgi:hypothetical protein
VARRWIGFHGALSRRQISRSLTSTVPSFILLNLYPCLRIALAKVARFIGDGTLTVNLLDPLAHMGLSLV